MRFNDSFGANTGHDFKSECAGIRTSRIGPRGPIHRGLDLSDPSENMVLVPLTYRFAV